MVIESRVIILYKKYGNKSIFAFVIEYYYSG